MKKINPLGGLDSILSGLGSLLIVAGIILLILRFVNEPNYWFFYNNSLVILLIGTFLLGISLIYSRIENIENKLEIEEKNQIRNLSFTNEQIYSDFLRQIRDKSFITKLSIFIPYQNEISRKFLQELIENRNFDSKVKILLGVDRNQHEDIVFNEFVRIIGKKREKFELKNCKKQTSFAIIIIDSSVWIINKFLDENEQGNLTFNVPIYSNIGKTFTSFFNRLWSTSKEAKLY